MQNIKKISLIVLVFIAIMMITGCGNKNVEGTLEDLMTKVYQDVPEDKRPMMLENITLNDDNIEYYIGTKDVPYEEALASESGIGSTAHSVVLLRVKDGESVEDVKTAIKDNVNPRKWVCVGVEDDEVIIKNKGNLVILIIVADEDTRATLEEGFDNL
ncbi:MAG: DUF4358 domain-containing protein [bacterium]|nr:DUF4358 domain-containing protein [bacterium]